MSDDIYDYFSGNATRKVEPIEDDDDDVTEQQAAPAETEAAAQSPAEIVTERAPEPRQADSPEPEAPVTAEETQKESGGHWDFLAGFLGIGGGKSKPAASKPAAAKQEPAPPKQAPASRNPKPVEAKQADVKSKLAQQSKSVQDETPTHAVSSSPAATDEDDLFAAFAGFSSPAKSKPEQKKDEPAPQRNERKPRSERKRKPDAKPAQESGATDFFGLDDVPSPEDSTPLKSMFGDSAAPAEASTNDASGNSNVDDADFIEFEIRDLVDSDEDEQRPRRRGRGRGRGRGRDNKAEQEEVVSDDSIDASESNRGDQAEESSDPLPDGGSRSRRSRGRGRRRRNQDDSATPKDDAPEEVAAESVDSTESRDAPESEGRGRSRRRRGRGRGRDRQREDTQVTSEENSTDDFDDIGWDPDGTNDTSSVAQPTSKHQPEDDDDSNEDRSRRRSRRGGRGRGRGRNDRDSARADSDRDDSFSDRSDSGSTSDEFDGFANSGSAGRGRGEQNSNRSDSGRKRERLSDIPTWDDAITGLIENNIKNHKSSPRGGGRSNSRRGGGGGRGGQRSGGRGRR